MGTDIQAQLGLGDGSSKASMDGSREVSYLASIPRSLLENGRPNSMVVKKVCPREFIPPHIVAEAISTLHGIDLRWSGPITQNEMLYVQQYVVAKYPQYSQGLIEEDVDKTNLYSLLGSPSPDSTRRRTSPKVAAAMAASSASPSCTASGSSHPALENLQLEPSRLQEILTKKSSFPGSFMSIPEAHARTRVLRHCGLAEEEYVTVFAGTHKDAMMLVGESYPFSRYNCYLTAVADEGVDCVREFATYKEAKVVVAPESWLDLRIKGSQLSQHFRRKCKHSPKGLFVYPVEGGNGMRYSMHWVSEAHRNAWHVLLDASMLVVGQDRLNLALHRPDLVLCTLDEVHSSQPSRVTCLLVRKKSFDAGSAGNSPL